MKIDYSKLTLGERTKGCNAQDTRELLQFRKQAKRFIESFEWCEAIEKDYFGVGIGGIFAVFLEKIKSTNNSVPELLWVIVGDLPPAYICADDAPNPASAIDGYIYEIQRWIDAVRCGDSLGNLIPVSAPATLEYAAMLESRLKFLDDNILSNMKDDLKK